MRARQRARVVGARVALVVVAVRAVVEEALDQAHARAVLHHAVGRAQALAVARQARRESPRRRALGALALAAALADELVAGRVPQARGDVATAQAGLGRGLQGCIQMLQEQLLLLRGQRQRLGLSPYRPVHPMVAAAAAAAEAAAAMVVVVVVATDATTATVVVAMAVVVVLVVGRAQPARRGAYQEALLRRGAAVAARAGSTARAGGATEARRPSIVMLSHRVVVVVVVVPVLIVVVHIDQYDLVGALVLLWPRGHHHARRSGPARHRRPLRVLVIGADGLDLVKREDGGMLELPFVVQTVQPALQGRLLDHY